MRILWLSGLFVVIVVGLLAINRDGNFGYFIADLASRSFESIGKDNDSAPPAKKASSDSAQVAKQEDATASSADTDTIQAKATDTAAEAQEVARVVAPKHCPGNDKALGVSRTVRIDTLQGPAFGFEHYKFYDFLKPKEVVLTFDDGPLPTHTVSVLKALKKHCTKATFFPVGKLAVGYPEVLRDIHDAGHTVANHTWAHKNLGNRKYKLSYVKAEIEKGASAVKAALGEAGAPFFRFPYLKDSPAALKYLGSRNFATFSTDIDSFDFKRGSPKQVVKRVMGLLKRKGKGIVLFHDANPYTARAMPALLDAMKREGYKVVHLTAKDTAETLASYDEQVLKLMNKGRPNMGLRPITSVVSTVSEEEATEATVTGAIPTSAAGKLKK